MIIKHADDKTKRLALLAELKKSAALDAQQKDWLDEELNRPGFPKGRHGKLKTPCGQKFITIPYTPSDRRTLLNIHRDLRSVQDSWSDKAITQAIRSAPSS